jgi:hypothetical protein
MYGQSAVAEYRGGYSFQPSEPTHNGYLDGLRDAQYDFHTGHSFRAESDGNFKHAIRGYYHGWGPKYDYKEAYREGYLRGYRRGYYGGY